MWKKWNGFIFFGQADKPLYMIKNSIQILWRNIWWIFFSVYQPFLIDLTITFDIRRNILHLWGIQNQDQKISPPFKKTKQKMCTHVLCNVNTTGIIFLWDFRVSMSMRAEQLFVHWWGDEVMCQQCTAHFLHSQSRDEVVTSIRSLQVESGVTCNPCVPHESVCERRLSRGLLLVGSAGIS